MLPAAGQSVSDHLLAKYLNSMMAIVLNQFNQVGCVCVVCALSSSAF